MSTRKVRYKKLNTKTPLPVLREDQIDPSEYESITTESQIATGVEQSEVNEYHLQAALRGVGASKDNEIPVPPPVKSDAKYDELYPTPYIEPRNYIKFSETVEETLTTLFDMTTVDDEYLKAYNGALKNQTPLSEDDFEGIMQAFEDCAAERAPYAAVDNTAVAWDDMITFEAVARLRTDDRLRPHVQALYDYWRNRRGSHGDKPLIPVLKFETHQEHDDLDPYVCFRRREVRQTRKTRARDVQMADKLKKLRRELEDGRQLIQSSHQREIMKREMLKSDRQIYEERAKLKQLKIRLNIKTDDDDLINVKPQKRLRTEAQQRGPPHAQLRLTVRPDGGRSIEPTDLVLLFDKLVEKENELRNDVETKIQNHKRWNQNYVDLTADPLPPVQEDKGSTFRPAKTTYLMTPPASSGSDSMEIDKPPIETGSLAPYVFKGVNRGEDEKEEMLSYRRRFGRLGRLFIDRRPAKTDSRSPRRDSTPSSSDRWKYDQDDDDDDVPIYHVDTNNLSQLRFRSMIPPPAAYNRRPDIVAPQLQAGARPALPHAPQLQGSLGDVQPQGQVQVQVPVPTRIPASAQPF